MHLSSKRLLAAALVLALAGPTAFGQGGGGGGGSGGSSGGGAAGGGRGAGGAGTSGAAQGAGAATSPSGAAGGITGNSRPGRGAGPVEGAGILPRDDAAGLSASAQKPLSDYLGDVPYAEPSARRSLSLTPNQLDLLNAADMRLREKLQKVADNFGQLKEEQRTQQAGELRRKYNRDLEQAAADILDGQQMARYRRLNR